MQRSWKNMGFIQWAILQGAPLERKMSYTMKICYTIYLVLMQSC